MQNTVDHGRPYSWDKSAREYAQYRDIYPPAFLHNLVEQGLCTGSQEVLDLGTGTGVLPRLMAPYGARFTGVDASEGQIAQARASNEALGQKNTILAIWVAHTYLTPITAVGAGSYVVWQNVINSWQLWRERKRQEAGAVKLPE